MVEKKKERRGLGRGLSALMADVQIPSDSQDQSDRSSAANRSAADQVLPIEQVVANPDQPRRDFRPDDLQDLTNSVRSKGVLQPLIVRPIGDNLYQIVAGERRWRAAQQAKLHEVPVLIRELSDTEVLEVAIIENIQRADLNAIEEAVGYRQLMDRFSHTQEKMAEALGKSRSHIANLLRLLNLPEDVQVLLRDGKLTTGHARALITSPNASQLAKMIVAKGLSVRETERLVKASVVEKKHLKTKISQSKDADTRALESDLSAALNMKVAVNHSDGQEWGTVTIRYRDLEQLDDLCRRLGGLE